MNQRRLARLLTPLAAAAAAASTAPAWAQSSEAQVVEVTASKRKQLVLDVPYAVTAIGSAEIQDRGVLDIRELQSSVPSLFITENAPGQSRIQLRGMSTLAGLPTVGSYLDDMTINLDQVQRAIDIPLVDIARIEVLRGPQGTLYGDGSLGGTIRYITRAPKLNKTEFTTEAGLKSVRYGETAYFANATANLPLAADTAALRIVAGYEKLPGWVDNSVPSTTIAQKDINGGDRQYIRGKLFVKLGNSADVSVMLYHYKLDQDNPTAARPDRTVPSYIASPNADKTTLANVTVNVDLGFATLTSSTGYTDRSLLQAVDVTEFFRPRLPPVLLPAGASIGLRTAMTFKVTTQELRLVSPDSGPLTWLAGAYYRSSDSTQTRTTPSSAAAPVTFLDQTGTSPTDSRQWAVFGEVSYAITPTVSITGGLRYFEDEQHLRSVSGGALTTGDAKFTATSPRLNLLWKYAKDASLYATISKGFRSGGFNVTPPPSYGPETLWNYEVGGKGRALGGKLQYDAALYYAKYDQVQSQDIPPGSIFATTVNTGKASGPGVDLAIAAELAPGLTLDASMGWIDLKYDVKTADRDKGDPLNYIPKVTAALGLTSRFRWPGLNMPGMVRLDLQHADSAPVIVRNQGLNTKTDPANYVNLRVGIEQPQWQVYLEGRNLNNFNGITNPAAGAQTENVRPMPRSLGVTVRAQF